VASTKETKALAKAEQAFWDGPVGRARDAKIAEQGWFQIELPVAETARTTRSVLFGDVATMTDRTPGQGAMLAEIEREGWELVHVGFVFHETGQISRDKFFSSGQSIKTTGITIGIYLFRETSMLPRDDEPWRDDPAAPPASWYPDPEVRHQLRYWNGSCWTTMTRPGTK
jgi:Protein of unknown function (DUF2510)